MTERDPGAVPEPTGGTPSGPEAAEQQRVARLLAAAASSAPALPEDVAGRLDETLARLAAERRETPVDDGVVDLGERRRRRWPGLLVAAATVSVVGLGVGTMLDTGFEGDSAATDAGSVVDEGAAGGGAEPEVAAEREASELDGSETESRAQSGQAPSPEALSADAARPPRLSTTSLVPDAQRIEDFSLAAPAPTPRLDRRCVDTGTSSGDTWLRVRLDGEPAVLVLRAPEGGRRTAEVFTCDDPGTPTASARIDER